MGAGFSPPVGKILVLKIVVEGLWWMTSIHLHIVGKHMPACDEITYIGVKLDPIVRGDNE